MMRSVFASTEAGKWISTKEMILRVEADNYEAFQLRNWETRRVSTTLRHIRSEFIEFCFLSLAVC